MLKNVINKVKKHKNLLLKVSNKVIKLHPATQALFAIKDLTVDEFEEVAVDLIILEMKESSEENSLTNEESFVKVVDSLLDSISDKVELDKKLLADEFRILSEVLDAESEEESKPNLTISD